MEPTMLLADHLARQPRPLMYSALPDAPLEPYRPHRSRVGALAAAAAAAVRGVSGAGLRRGRTGPAHAPQCTTS